MNSIGLLLCISGFIATDASTFCYGYYATDATCYDTTITDDYVYCYGYGACQQTQITASADVKCKGYYGCAHSDSIESTGSSIYCDGSMGCYYADEISASNQLYCDGEQTCAYSGDLSANTIHCDGDWGCAFARGDITASSWVLCDGTYGCYRVSGTISGSSVYTTGVYAVYGSNIETMYDVVCGARYSCGYATIDAGRNVYVMANYGGNRATIDATGHVYCEADYGCYYATITSGNIVYLEASYAAYYADITADYVYIYGRYGASQASITGTSGSSLSVSLYGFNSGWYGDIYALETSNTYDAYINCYCDSSCRNLYVYHYGALSKIYVYPTDCKDYEGTTNPDGLWCPSFTASTSMTVEQHKAMRQTQAEASEDYEELKKQAEEPVIKAEKERIAAEKDVKAKMAEADKIGIESNRNKIFANVGLLGISPSGVNIITFCSMIVMTALLTFVMTNCYHSRCKDEDIKYQPLL